MAVFKKQAAPVAPRSVVASAVRFELGGAQTWKTMPEGDRRWQAEAWYHYDACTEFMFAASWKGNLSSRATLYVAEIDPQTGRPGKPTTDPKMLEIGRKVLGGPTNQGRHTASMVKNFEVAGEVYSVVLSGGGEDGDDEWLTLSVTEMNFSGGNVEITDPKTNAPRRLTGDDLYIRHWDAHPRLQLNANAPARSLLPVLREIEAASRAIAAHLDSRLASNGILKVPTEADFVSGDDDPEEGNLVTQMARSMASSLQNPGSASAQVPIIIQADRENLAAIEHIDLSMTPPDELMKLRSDGIQRLYTGVDIPREILAGLGSSSNHWGAWKVSEDTYTTHIAPKLELIADGLTRTFLIPMAEAAGVKDPAQRFMLMYDGSDIVAEPDPLAESTELFDRGIISADAVRRRNSVPDEDKPRGEDAQRALAERLVTAAPTLLIQFPELGRLLGLTTGPPAAAPASVPQAIETTGPPEQGVPSGDFRAASMAVVYALERAGNRLLNAQRLKEEFAHVPRHEMHAHLKPDLDRHGNLLEGAWRHCPILAQTYALDQYAHLLLSLGEPHTEANLRDWLARRG